EIERRFHELDPAVELARHLWVDSPTGFAPVFRSQPRFSALLASKRALIALNALWPVIRITLVAKRRLRFCNRREMNTGIKVAADPFLDAKDDKPVSAKFRGTEWGDEIGRDEIPLTARVVTTRIAKMPWGAIFKIEFADLKSRAKKHREIRPDYFIVTEDRIVL